MKQHHHEQAPVKMIAMISKLRMIWGGEGRGNTEQVILFWKNEFINKEKNELSFLKSTNSIPLLMLSIDYFVE